MQPRLILTTLFSCLLFIAAFPQNKNPYQSIGKKEKVLTLTNGKYEEFFDNDSIQQIGNALVNIREMKVVKLLSNDEAEKRLDNSTNSRFLSVDPLTSTYTSLTPYQYASNSPIAGTDLDGKEFTYYSWGYNQQPVLINGTDKQVLTFAITGIHASPTNIQDDQTIAAGNVTIGLEAYNVTVMTWDVNFSFKMSDLGIKANIINVNGVDRVLPEDADLDNLPDANNEYWTELETRDSYLGRIKSKAKEYGSKIAMAAIPFTMMGSKEEALEDYYKRSLARETKPLQEHHFLSNKSSKFTKQYEKIVKKYGLKLDDGWNKEKLPHSGAHTDTYKKWVLTQLQRADQGAKGVKDKFLELVEEYIKKPVREDPNILYKAGENKIK